MCKDCGCAEKIQEEVCNCGCEEHSHNHADTCHCGCEEHAHTHEGLCDCGCEEHKTHSHK
ncbi:hypothetical protein [Clostridium massiliamazoniense]|uniref:hypothetical protein n=1 Tax=Clostridium massiliamazoniense TaxID=1347366 RepID=UPI0006D80FFF|nr:hypothetical protein [Clostridium massiliamazoniense]